MQTLISPSLPNSSLRNGSQQRPNLAASWAQRYAAWCLRRELRAARPGQQAEALRRAHF